MWYNPAGFSIRLQVQENRYVGESRDVTEPIIVCTVYSSDEVERVIRALHLFGTFIGGEDSGEIVWIDGPDDREEGG